MTRRDEGGGGRVWPSSGRSRTARRPFRGVRRKIFSSFFRECTHPVRWNRDAIDVRPLHCTAPTEHDAIGKPNYSLLRVRFFACVCAVKPPKGQAHSDWTKFLKNQPSVLSEALGRLSNESNKRFTKLVRRPRNLFNDSFVDSFARSFHMKQNERYGP